MSGHTPGPWTWETESGDWPDDCLVGSNGDPVLQWDMDLGFQFGEPGDKPLIAAAPTLLAELHEATRLMVNLQADEYGPRENWPAREQIERQEAAIAAAEPKP